MNIDNPDFLAHSREAFRANKPPTLAELRSQVGADRTLDKTKRRDLLSALNRLPTWFGRPLAAIPATPTALRDLFAGASAAKLDLATKTLANVRSLVVQVVTRYGPPQIPITRKIPLDTVWRDRDGDGSFGDSLLPGIGVVDSGRRRGFLRPAQ